MRNFASARGPDLDPNKKVEKTKGIIINSLSRLTVVGLCK